MKRLFICAIFFLLVACGDGSSSGPISLPPPPPEAHQSVLTWEPNREPDLAGYHVYRSLISIEYLKGEFIGTTTDTTFLDNTGTIGVVYFYVVSAFDSAGNESEFSNEVSKLY